jgi:hypothetical protein
MKKVLFIALSALSAGAFAQVQIDKQIQMTGSTPTDRRITNVADPTADQDAATKKYVDDNSGGGGHYLGEVFGGGVIFSLSQDGLGNETGLVVSPVNLSSGRSWSNTNNVVVGTTDYNGWANSNLINTQNTNSAAGNCRASTQGGYNDWYLPSILELKELGYQQLYAARGLAAMGGTQIHQDNPYWSSSEWSPWDPQGTVIAFNLGSMGADYANKAQSRWVRCIRDF